MSSKTPGGPPCEVFRRRRSRIEAWLRRHRGLFWTVHSLWALTTGGFVVFLAHESYAVIPWIFGMLALTWLSTFFFCRIDDSPDAPTAARLGGSFLSYLNRVMYQETLFFLIPFYAYSTTLRPMPEWSALFLALLGVLAVVSCIDMLFDRWARHSIAFALSFFALVAFAALNLLLPIVFRIDLERSAAYAAAFATASALLLSLSGPPHRSRERLVAVPLVVTLGLGLSASAESWVPPVPLRAQEASFARDVTRSPLAKVGEIPGGEISQAELGDRLTAWFRVFSPTRLHADVKLRWELDGVEFRESREVTIEGHREGFRVWDALVFEDGIVPRGTYAVSLFAEGRPLARHELRVVPGPSTRERARSNPRRESPSSSTGGRALGRASATASVPQVVRGAGKPAGESLRNRRSPPSSFERRIGDGTGVARKSVAHDSVVGSTPSQRGRSGR